MRADGTRSLPATAPTTELQEPPPPATTAADQVFDLTESTGSLRSQARNLHEDTSALHQTALVIEWQRLTNLRGRTAPAALLQELADLGFGWRDIARMLKVSVPAVQKWRRNGGVSGPNRRSIASLLALCDLVRNKYMIEEIASWFEMPVSQEAPVTPIDLYAEDRVLPFARLRQRPGRRRATPECLRPRLARTLPLRLRGVHRSGRQPVHPP